MANRVRLKTMTFQNPFELAGYDRVLPAGGYQVEIEEELIEGLSFSGYRRLFTLLHLHPETRIGKFGPTLKVDPNELDEAFVRDLASSDSVNKQGLTQNVPEGTT